MAEWVFATVAARGVCGIVVGGSPVPSAIVPLGCRFTETFWKGD